jgi:ATP-dependent helicase/nuclease subunit A
MRSPNKAAYTYSSILNHYGIPSVSSSKYTLFNELEIRTVMSLLKVIDNPYRDRDLITVLHCPVYNVTCSELAVLKLVDTASPIYDNVLKYIEKNNSNDVLADKLIKFTDFMKDVHTLMLSKPFCEILSYILVTTDYLNYLSLIKNSSIRITNIKLLTAMAEQIYNSGITDFGGIVSSLCDIEQENPVFESAASAEYENAVRILSIHKSKGLEFPIVFVAQFDKNLTKMSTPEETLIDADFGIALKHFDTELRVKTDFPYKTATAFLAKHNELMEELRLLYVALTRAKEKLIMVAVPKKYDERMKKLEQYANFCENGTYLPLSAISEATSYLDWVMLAYLRRGTFQSDINIDDIFEITTTDISDVSTDSFGTEHIKGIYNSISANDAPKAETEALNNRLTGSFFDTAAVTLPSKISISEIKRQSRINEYKSLEYNLNALNAPNSERILHTLSENKENDTQISFKPPAFMQEDKKTLYGAERGTAYHTVFEHLKPDYEASLEDVTRQIEKLYERRLLSTSEFNSVKPEKFIAYLQSELGKRICNAKKIYRETPFVMQLSPNEVYPDPSYNDTSAKMLVHGIIDLYFEENDELVLVDYKTDIVSKKNPAWAICERYKIQLDYYKKALELSSNKRVKEMYLYLVDIDQAIKVESE